MLCGKMVSYWKKVCGLWISGLDWLNILLSFKSCFCMQLSPLSTLESSFEALNVKKFDGDLKSYSVSVTCLMMLVMFVC